MKKTFTTMAENIDELIYEYIDLNSSDIEDSSGNSHFQFHNNPASFNRTKKLKKDPEYSVKTPGLTTPTGMMLQKAF